MVNKYEKHYEVTKFEIGDYCTIQVSKKDPPQCLSHPYTPPGQTKHGILCSRYTVKNLNQIDQATVEVGAREIGNSRRKIILR